MIATIPRVYPGGGPLYWMDEQSGLLRGAVCTYLNFRTGQGPAPSTEQIALLGDYLDYWVEAPAWRGPQILLATLRARSKELRGIDEISLWLRDALEAGIDPL